MKIAKKIVQLLGRQKAQTLVESPRAPKNPLQRQIAQILAEDKKSKPKPKTNVKTKTLLTKYALSKPARKRTLLTTATGRRKVTSESLIK